MQKNKIVCLVGESGAGKTFFYDVLRLRGWKVVDSFTTRPPRFPGEKGHTFVSTEEFNSIRSDLLAYTMFNGYEYGTTKQQIEDCNFYVIDPDGVKYLADKIGRDNFTVVYIYASEEIRFKRMVEDRGETAAIQRINHDREKFRSFIENEDWDFFVRNENYEFDKLHIKMLESWYRTSNLEA